VSAAGRGARPVGTGRGSSNAHEVGDEGGGVRSGWAMAGSLPWAGSSAQCRF
jgi:hypothetical protein